MEDRFRHCPWDKAEQGWADVINSCLYNNGSNEIGGDELKCVRPRRRDIKGVVNAPGDPED